jgi:hypothetical protein
MAGVEVGLQDWYVPDITGTMADGKVWFNRKDPDPFKVLMRALSGRELQVLRQEAVGAFTEGANKANVNERALEALNAVIAGGVTDVYGWRSRSLSIPGKFYTPKDGAELMEALLDGPPEALDQVRNDLIEALENHSKLARGLLGNLKRQSASPASTNTQPENGAAVNVDAKTKRKGGRAKSSGEKSGTATA